MYQAAVLLHLASAIVWIGGSLFLALVLLPVLRKIAAQSAQGESNVGLPPGVLGSVARRFRWMSWLCIVLLVATGFHILPSRYGIGFNDFFTLGGHFVGTLQIKVALVAMVIWLRFMQDFLLGPYVNRLLEAAQSGAEPHRRMGLLRRTLIWVARVNVALMVAIVVVAVTMTRGVPV
jgi:putative copper resistance protein D